MEARERRQRALTDADVEAIREAFAAAHPCRFRIPQEEFEATWPVMKDIADNVHSAVKLSKKIIVSGLVMFFFGLIARGAWNWVAELHSKFK